MPIMSTVRDLGAVLHFVSARGASTTLI